jgi:hypothetical protein
LVLINRIKNIIFLELITRYEFVYHCKKDLNKDIFLCLNNLSKTYLLFANNLNDHTIYENTISKMRKLRHGIKIVINDLNINEVVDDINFIDLKT